MHNLIKEASIAATALNAVQRKIVEAMREVREASLKVSDPEIRAILESYYKQLDKVNEDISP